MGGDVDKLVKISIVVASLLAGFGVFYHYVIYLPDVEQLRIDKEHKVKSAYNACVVNAQKSYSAQWEGECKAIAKPGAKAGSEQCRLPGFIAERVNKLRDDDLARCIEEAKLF